MVGPDGALPLPWLKPWLDRALQTQRAHAVLVHGAQGIGQWELALSLAQAWLCEDAAATKPCGRCASCRLVQAHSPPRSAGALARGTAGIVGLGERR